MKIPTYVNRVIFMSIPISKDLKRYLLNVYVRLNEHNGPKYAADRFKTISECCLAYRADPNRGYNREKFVRNIPLSHKGWVRRILLYMDSHPMYMLNLLKMYVGPREPLVTVQESAEQQKQYLDSRRERVKTQVPYWLIAWLNFVLSRSMTDARHSWNVYHEVSCGEVRKWRELVHAHTYDELDAYRRKWRWILLMNKNVPTAESMIESVRTERFPFPEVYKDYDANELTSAALEKDLMALDQWFRAAQSLGNRDNTVPLGEYSPISAETVRYIVQLAGFGPYDLFEGHRDFNPQSDPNDYTLMVGDIHHIPKKGTIKRRPIGVPNRFIQMGCLPIQRLLETVVKRLPKDCTFDQGRFDDRISSRVSSPRLYIGSVDLSQATDNLPLEWGRYIVDTLLSHGSIPSIYKKSWACFLEAARGTYYNGGVPTKWTVGQPLGTLPSFDLLSITHNCVLEALAFNLRLLHSPYFILGDDLLVCNKKLRSAYIRFMSNAGVPLSLHKSYQGDLVEFAGKIFIKNQIPAYRSDQLPITWNSLFDYQRATGIRIGWDKLPRQLKLYCEKAITELLSQHVKRYTRLKPKVNGIYPLAKAFAARAYNLASEAMVIVHGSQDILSHQKNVDLIASMYILLEDEEETPNDQLHKPPIFRVGSDILAMQKWCTGFKSGHRFRYKACKLPDWYRTKFRPNTSSKVVQSAFRALVGWD